MLPFAFWQRSGGQRAQSQGEKHFQGHPLGETPLLSRGAFNTGKAAAVHWGTGVNLFGKAAEKKAISLAWGWRGERSPVPLLSSLLLLGCWQPRVWQCSPGFVSCAGADTFQQAATQTQTSKGWHVCFLKQLSRFYWAINYSDEDIKTKL